jgi:polar amino acid transport system substrate-binding protein/glutamate/aspartate transport system substrate-binding protein
MRKISFACIILALFVLSAISTAYPGALDKIEESGVFRVGAREGALGFAYHDEKGNWVGFSMDIAKEVHKQLEKKLGKSIDLKFVPVTAKTRIPVIVAGSVDVVIGIAAWTRKRDETVDFAIPHFFTATRILTRTDSPIKDFKDLAGKRVGCVVGTTNEINLMALSKKLPEPIKLLTFEKHTDSFLALQQEKTVAHVTDDSVLAGLMKTAKNPKDWHVVGTPLATLLLCPIVPENDSKLRDFISHSIMELMDSGKYWEIFDKWFGPKGVIPYEMAKEGKILLENLAVMK